MEAAAETLAQAEGRITKWIVAALAALTAILGALASSRGRRLKETKAQLEASRRTGTRKKEELDGIAKLIEGIAGIDDEAHPERVPPPDSGDSDSRLDRLSRLHEH